jgi:hypothetical protein
MTEARIDLPRFTSPVPVSVIELCYDTVMAEWTAILYPIRVVSGSDLVPERDYSEWDLKFSRRWLWRMVSSGMLRRVALVW